MTQPFGENALVKKIDYYPFPQDRSKVLHFQDIDRGQDCAQLLPDFDTAQLESVTRRGLTMRVHTFGALNTRNMTAVALAGVGATNAYAERLLNVPRPGLDAQRKLGGTSVDTQAIASSAIGLSFWRGALAPDENATHKISSTLRVLDESRYRYDFLDIIDCIAKGLSAQQMGTELGKSRWWARDALFELRVKLCASIPELVMIAGGLGFLPPDEAPVIITPSQVCY